MNNARYNTVRRLPVYFLVDSSGSMGIDSAMESVKRGLGSLKERIERDDDRMTRSTLYVSAYAFDDDVRPLTEGLELIGEFNPRLESLDPGGQTRLSKALYEVQRAIQRDYRPSVTGVHGRKGDYRPIVFLLTDGVPDPPDDPWQDARAQLLQMEKPKLLRYVVVGCGDDILDENLRAIGKDDIFHIEKDHKSFEAFFDWVSSSLVLASRSSNRGLEEFDLAEAPEAVRNVGVWRSNDYINTGFGTG